MSRIILHADMDAFFASVEQRDNPDLRGKPVLVGGSPAGRGVVAAASYEARRYGARSAMPMARALRLCPEAIRVPPRFEAYRETSMVIRGLFLAITPIVEPLSLDEAYLDLAPAAADFDSAEEIGRRLKREVREATGLAVSVGIGPNKFLAKVASDHDKPDGFCSVRPAAALGFLAPLPVRTVPGVGPKTGERLRAEGIATILDLRNAPLERLTGWLGHKHGTRLHELARGVDESPVVPERERKSLSTERTFARDLTDWPQILDIVRQLSGEVGRRLAELNLRGRSIGIKVRFSDFAAASRSISIDNPTNDPEEIARLTEYLMNGLPRPVKPIRLLGVRAAGFDPPPSARKSADDMQLRLF